MKAKNLNTEVRKAMKSKGLTLYQVANTMGISKEYLSVMLQSSLTLERKRRILEAIRNCNSPKAIAMNCDIRKMIADKNIAMYEIANELHITPSYLFSWFQKELSDERKEMILKAIDSIEQ